MSNLNNLEIIESYTSDKAFYKIFADGTIVQGLYWQMEMGLKIQTFNLLKKISKVYTAQITQSGSDGWLVISISLKVMPTQFTVYATSQASGGWVLIWGKVNEFEEIKQ